MARRMAAYTTHLYVRGLIGSMHRMDACPGARYGGWVV